MAWKDKVSFLSPPYTISKVGSGDKVDDIRFYPISLGLAFKLRNVGKPLVAALTTLFSSDKNDTGTTQRTVHYEKDRKPDTETVIEPISIELATLRSKQRQEAVAALMEAITSDENLDIIGEIIIDSMRDTFEGTDKPKPREFIQTITPEVLFQLVMGVARANKGAFGPLAKLFDEAAQTVGTAVRRKLGVVKDEEQPETKVKPRTDGEPSETMSSSASHTESPKTP